MQLQNPLWAFALKVYSSSEVEQCCLCLQNQFGMSINRLLFAAWLATQHKLLDMVALEQSSVQQWQRDITHPLRTLRYQVRQMKNAEPELDAFYLAMRKAELEAERVELAHLYRLSESWPEVDGAVEVLMSENIKRLNSDNEKPEDAPLFDLLAVFCQHVLNRG